MCNITLNVLAISTFLALIPDPVPVPVQRPIVTHFERKQTKTKRLTSNLFEGATCVGAYVKKPDKSFNLEGNDFLDFSLQTKV